MRVTQTGAFIAGRTDTQGDSMTTLAAFILGCIVGAIVGGITCTLVMAALGLARRCDDQDGQP